MFKGMDYAYRVYKEKSISKAAEKMFISQPSLSANIKRIEAKIGYPIFDRSAKPLELTTVGRQYIQSVEKIMAIEDEFEAFVNDMGTLKKGRLMFGGSNFFSSWVLPPIISDFAKEYPNLEISLTEAKSADLIEALRDSKIHFLMDNKDIDLTVFEQIEIGKEQLLLAVPKHFEINFKLSEYQVPLEKIKSGEYKNGKIPPVDLKAFEGYPFILLHTVNDTGKRAQAICQDYDFKPNVLLELDQQLTAYNIASTGAGVTFSGEILIARVPPNPNLVYYRLSGPNIERHIYLSWKRGRYMSKAMQVFLQFAEEHKTMREIAKHGQIL